MIGLREIRELLAGERLEGEIKYFDYGRKTVAVWDDIVEFFYEVNPRYREIGTRPKRPPRCS